ncbi:DUF459 domain-containing protein [Ancylobacter vacuolatus]|uniref:DUF459 domain-containing protein n=1 Tax=Ancylobacter vacuolatus TaxID=223389 RepID=A0ABU0DND0_9HYPH|nr:DUF459 domain-containing protein [Ancylobacter vacuolatus]MDQ0349934.1 hypothetical protein [Ancylobacter vacuolatus]
MRGRRGNRLGLKALAVAGVLVAGCSLAQAQSDWFRPPADVGQPSARPSQQQRPQQQQQRQQARPQQRAAPPPQAAEPRRAWSPFQPLMDLFGGRDNRPRRVRPMEPELAPPPPVVAQPPAEPRGKVYASSSEARAASGEVKEVVLVFGDEQAGTLAQGLADAFAADRETAAVVARAEADAGFAPGSGVDLIAAARQLPTGSEQANVIVVLAGSHDLEPITDAAGVRAELFDERWRDLYSRRVEDFLLALKLQRRNVVVVGLPPVEDAVRNEQIARYNALLKEMVERSGFIFVDVTDGFVDENGKFMMSGPAVDGQRRRLRTADGVGFTRAGARKLAFFVDQKLDDLLTGKDLPPTAADPAETRPSIIMLTGGPPAGNARALAGAPGVLSANEIRRSPMDEDAAPAPARMLVEGTAPSAVPGRTDDFRWPPGQPEEPLVPPMPQAPLTATPTP